MVIDAKRVGVLALDSPQRTEYGMVGVACIKVRGGLIVTGSRLGWVRLA